MLSFLIIGTFGTALPFCILLYSLRFTTPANLAILNQAEMLYSLLLSYILLKEIPSVKQLFASALILLGVTAILFEGKLSINKGDIIVLSCLWMFQISHIAAKKLPREMPHALISAAKNFYSLPILVLLLCLSGGMFIKWNTDLFIVLGFTGIIRYGLSTLLWFIAIRSMHLAKATAIALSFPALTLLISVALGYDTLNAYKVAGLALTMAGAWWLNTIAGQKAQG